MTPGILPVLQALQYLLEFLFRLFDRCGYFPALLFQNLPALPGQIIPEILQFFFPAL